MDSASAWRQSLSSLQKSERARLLDKPLGIIRLTARPMLVNYF